MSLGRRDRVQRNQFLGSKALSKVGAPSCPPQSLGHRPLSTQSPEISEYWRELPVKAPWRSTGAAAASPRLGVVGRVRVSRRWGSAEVSARTSSTECRNSENTA